MRITFLLAIKFDKTETENENRQAEADEPPFHIALIWDGPFIKWAIGVVFYGDACLIVAGVILT